MQTAEPEVHDGVALLFAGDVVLTLWNAPARLHRSRWVYDRVDEFASKQSNGLLALMIILPTAEMPDGATRAENSTRLRRLAPSVRRLVTVIQGDEFRDTVVRSGLRLMSLPLGAGRVVVTSNLRDAFAKLSKSAGPHTPPLPELREAAVRLYFALGLELPETLRDALPT